MNVKINFDNWHLDTLPTIVICVFLPLFLYFALWLFITGVIGAIRMLQSKYWTPTIGKIIDTTIKYKDFNREGTKSRQYVKLKTYLYFVNGKYYIGKNTLASDYLYAKEYRTLQKNSQFDANIVLDSLKSGESFENIKGESTTVYYSPKKPKNSCLENRFDAQIILPIFMGLLFGGGLLYLTYFLLRIVLE